MVQGTPAEAERAKKWFNRSFVDSSRIAVDIVEDIPLSRPNKRPRLGPSSLGSDAFGSVESSKSKSIKSKTTLDPRAMKDGNDQLSTFMQVMQPRTKKGPSWANGDSVAQPIASTSVSNEPSSLQSKSKTREAPAILDSRDDETEAVLNEGISDLDWLKQRTKQTSELLDDDTPARVFDQSDDEKMDDTEEHKGDTPGEPPIDPTKATILQTSRLFLRNLSFSCTEAELMDLFKSFGEVSQVHIPLDPTTKQPKGVAYVSFAQADCAVAAYEVLDKTSFQGRLLHILPAVDRKGKVHDGEGDAKKKSLKQDREAKKKAGAGKEFNWTMLYMNSDAVASSIADRMNVSKADILNPESDNAAVKLALAETHIIQETKSFLESHGVVFSALSPSSGRVARSDTIILVKNIPYGTSAADLRALFEPHGELRRVLVPPAGTMAVVEFVHGDEGRRAFRAIAYRRLGNSVIYLEKGPEGMLNDEGDAPIADGETSEPLTATGIKPIAISEPVVGAVAADTDEPSPAAGMTLFVKNLSFSTTSEKLTQVLRHLPAFAFARVQTKPDPARAGARLSMGYGFGLVLDGHTLAVKWAGRGADEGEDKKGSSKAHTTKMIVKNVPFEATKKDIRELFGAHAQLKSVRLPRKFDHRTRGFAFLDFTTRLEAERAYSTLRHTHFLGRHLVLEWAEEGEVDLDELRRKAGAPSQLSGATLILQLSPSRSLRQAELLGNSKVFRGSLVRNGQGPRDVVCKLAIGKRRIGRLSAEAGFYTKELKDLQGCLVLDYVGETLDHPLFSMNFEFRYAVMKAVMSMHFAGVKQCDLEERNIVVDKNGRPFIIDFDNAMEHKCKLAIPIVFNTKQPSYSKLKCLELYSAGKMAQAWTPGRVYYMLNYVPIKYATSPETLMKKAPKGSYNPERLRTVYKLLTCLHRFAPLRTFKRFNNDSA
ncbi:Multiple RNA-binding domain-containing protein 1 [Grifola frondosa]|uniref:Multiple RNA-binding domain-containing protein 1 n=1 Tax=Grifola frondosa TaxID=5627 RepID=A0A1C7MCW8_GRIFR|nr:Multiple RNA-binding domain-containing protein 1 [Grifola frondosa]